MDTLNGSTIAALLDNVRSPAPSFLTQLKVIFDNGTGSEIMVRSLERQFHADPAGRRISDPDVGPLFGSSSEEGDLGSGTIYVLRSKSPDQCFAEHHNVIHKIGVTGNDVEARISQAWLSVSPQDSFRRSKHSVPSIIRCLG